MKPSKPYCRGDFPYRSIDDIEYANERRANHYFFAPDSMRFFSSRILHGVYGGRYFVTSERCDWGPYPRLFTVREALPSGKVEMVGEFQEFSTARAAKRYAESIAPDHSVYLANLVTWAHEHAQGDWRQAADYAGLTHKQDRAELRRMFRKYAREVVAS